MTWIVARCLCGILALLVVSTGGVGWAADPIDWSKPYARMNVGIVGGGVAAAATGDSCTGSLLFSWHGENADVTSGSPAGCSVGDTTGTAAASSSISSDYYTDGGNSVKVVSGSVNRGYVFTWSSSDIVNPNAGTIDFYFRTSAVSSNIIISAVYVDSDNRIYISLISSGYVVLNHIAGGTSRGGRTTFPIISADTWYHCKARWDTTAHSGLYIKMTCDETTGEGNSADNGTSALGSWSGTSGTMTINVGGSTSDVTMYVDQVKIYNSWQ